MGFGPKCPRRPHYTLLPLSTCVLFISFIQLVNGEKLVVINCLSRVTALVPACNFCVTIIT